MKKSVILIFVLIFISAGINAWEDCPFGEVYCEGQCGRFIDTDGDSICDHSQPAPGDRNLTQENATAPDDAPSGTPDGNSSGNAVNLSKINAVSEDKVFGAGKQVYRNTYNVIPISIALLVLYVFGLILVKRKILSIALHRKIWNVLLLFSFLGVGILGLLLVIKISYGLPLPLPFNDLFWHVEFGIAMAIISVFHVIWHRDYFRNILKPDKKIK